MDGSDGVATNAHIVQDEDSCVRRIIDSDLTSVVKTQRWVVSYLLTSRQRIAKAQESWRKSPHIKAFSTPLLMQMMKATLSHRPAAVSWHLGSSHSACSLVCRDPRTQKTLLLHSLECFLSLAPLDLVFGSFESLLRMPYGAISQGRPHHEYIKMSYTCNEMHSRLSHMTDSSGRIPRACDDSLTL